MTPLSPDLTIIQHEILIGTILGDVHLETQNDSTYRVRFEQSNLKHGQYVDHLYDNFKNFTLSPPSLVKSNKNKLLLTRYLPTFTPYGKLFYKDKVKIIPANIKDYLTPRSLAYWYMDDGALKGKNRKGKRLHTECFTKTEVEILCSALNELGIKTTINRQYDDFILYITSQGDDVFSEMIKPYIIPSMEYKLYAFNNKTP